MSTDEDAIVDELSPDAELGTDDAEGAAEVGTLQHPEGEPVTDAPPPRSQAEIDALQEKLAREAERHAKRVAEIMGEDFALLVPSPVDWTPGYLFAVPEMLPTPEQVAAFHAILGGVAPLELQTAADAEGCATCNALGQVLTGSRVPGQETKPCGECNGSGWRHIVTPPALVAPFGAPPPGYSQAVPMDGPIQVADAFGRPFGHPHYGLNPAQVGV